MNAAQTNPTDECAPVCMVRRTLTNLPEAAPPAGWSVRWYQPGDEGTWLRIQLAAERQHAITPELFRQQFGHDESSLTERQCFLLTPDRNAVGTATAWFDDAFEGARWGRVHWVAIGPEHQGRGLGGALMTAVCQRLHELGHERAFLRTAANRVPAVRLYLRFGFEPHPRTAEEERLWPEILARLGRVA